MEWTKKNWRLVLLLTVGNILLSAIVAFTVNAISAREIALQGSASVEYVDKQDNATCDYVDKQDAAIRESLSGQGKRIETVEAKVDLKADKADVIAMRITIEKIYDLLLEEKKMK